MRSTPILLALFFASCGASSTLILEQPSQLSYEGEAVPASFSIRPSSKRGEVPAETVAAFENRVRRKLVHAGVRGIQIEYRFLHTGNDEQLERWFTSGSGRRSVTIDVVFKNAGEERLGRIQAEGRVKPGLFGGSFQGALNRAADEIADYAIATYGGVGAPDGTGG